MKTDPAEFYRMQGDMIDYVYALVQNEFPDRWFYAASFEFGTLGDSLVAGLRSLRTLAFENQMYWYGAKVQATRERIERDLQEVGGGVTAAPGSWVGSHSTPHWRGGLAREHDAPHAVGGLPERRDAMPLEPPYHNLPSAYFLHYFFGFQTRRNRPVFVGELQKQITAWLEEVCAQGNYHLLAHQIQERRLEMLLSLRPTHSISKVVQDIKSTVARQVFTHHPETEALVGRRNLWASGYKVESVGAATAAMVKGYLDSQREHHSVQAQEPRALVRYAAPDRQSYGGFHKGKAVYRLNHHYVFTVKQRPRVLDEKTA